MDYITNPHRYNGRFAIALLLASALLAMSCNAVKRVMKDPEKFDKVGKAWLKAQPTPTGIPEDSTAYGKPDTTWHRWGINPDGSLWLGDMPSGYPDAKDSVFWQNDSLYAWYPETGSYYTGLTREKQPGNNSAQQAGTKPKDCPPCPGLAPQITKPKTVFTTPQSVKDQIKTLVAKLDQSRQDHSRDTALLRADIVRLNGEVSNMTERRDKWRNRAISTWVVLALIIAGFLFARKYKA